MRTQKTRGLRRLGIAVGLVAGAIGLAAAPAMAQVIAPGTLVANKGGYRAVGTNTADGFAKPLANAIFEYSTSSAFPAVPTPFAATDALGVASASVPPATYYVREKTSPANWLSIPTLEWNGSTSAYRSTGTAVASGQSETAEAAGDSVRFVNERVNPAITTSCRAGLSVLLVMDTSGSTANYRTDYANAANAFVNTLSGTSTSLKISTFATTSKPGVVTYDLATAPGQRRGWRARERWAWRGGRREPASSR
jgi:hypothetical protein